MTDAKPTYQVTMRLSKNEWEIKEQLRTQGFSLKAVWFEGVKSIKKNKQKN